MKLEVLKILDELQRKTKFIVIDKDNYGLPFTPINNFLQSKITTSTNRLRDYTYGLIKYFEWLSMCNVHYLNIYENHIITYVNFLESEPDRRTNKYKLLKEFSNLIEIDPKMKKKEAINKQISVVRQFYSYLLKSGCINSNPCPLETRSGKGKGNVDMLAYTHCKKKIIDTIKSKKNDFDVEQFLNGGNINEKDPFTPQEIQSIMSLLKNSQERLLICMLFLGMRISEALGRRISDIKWSQRIVTITKREDDPEWVNIKYDSQRNLEIRGVLYFNNLVEIMHDSYNEYVHEVLRPNKLLNPRKFLFIKLQGNPGPLSYTDIYNRIIKNNLQKKITNRNIGFHSFRHHFSTTNIGLGRPLEEVQKLLGHSDISTTIKYYYNPSIRFLKELVVQGIITMDEAEKRTKYILDYKKKFCKF
ncbi:tyrosine-type recombinase/integrase [Clostridium sp. DJ247]|uniref:tyrosine-type recombinase/integrase n=1 Tax=Clostridium sp. DJ247 TaxID=2726188 RepID=UPI0016255376|nr:tyrosine-type recombinase/integrase [Clostridium sp. DJ247]MBC2579867.1 tyrosine-type recombinase/integrase [Clostridium sp. DJ247]